jgi:hypothetical protein
LSLGSGVARKHPLVFLAYVYPPDNYAGAARPARLAKYLERLGHPVSVIAATPEEGCRIEGNVYRVRGEMEGNAGKSFSGYVEKAARILLFRHDEGFTWIPRAVNLAKRWRDMDPKPVVLSTSPPLTTHLAALVLKKNLGWRWIADFRDPLVGNPFRLGSLVRGSDRLLERAIFRNADAMIANTDAVLDSWIARYPQWRAKCHVVWNGFDPEEALAAEIIPLRPYKVLAHVGVIYGERHPAPLLSAARRLIERGSLDPLTIRICLVGPCDRSAFPVSDDFEVLARLGCLECQGMAVPREEARSIAASADYLLLLDVLQGRAGLQVPGKLFDYLCVGRPILACTTHGSPVERILSSSGVPHTVLYPDAPSPENADRLLAFLSNPSTCTRPSAWFNNQFNAEAQALALSSIVEQVVSRS